MKATYFYLVVLVIFSSSCEKNKYIYDSSLFEKVILRNKQKFFKETFQIKKLDTINFNLFTKNSETNLLINNSYLTKFTSENSIYDKLFYHGEKKIQKNVFELFSFVDYFGDYPEEQIGFLNVRNKINTTVKVFHSITDNSVFLRSYFSNNYLLILQANDENYDVIDECKRKQNFEKYCVLTIEKDGNIVLLNQQKSREVLDLEFVK